MWFTTQHRTQFQSFRIHVKSNRTITLVYIPLQPSKIIPFIVFIFISFELKSNDIFYFQWENWIETILQGVSWWLNLKFSWKFIDMFYNILWLCQLCSLMGYCGKNPVICQTAGNQIGVGSVSSAIALLETTSLRVQNTLSKNILQFKE